MSWEDEDYSPDVPVVATLGAEDKTWEELNEDRGAEGGATAAAAVATGTKPKHAEKEKVRSRDAAAAREREEMARAAVEAGVPLTDPAAERKRLEALQLKADMAAARDSLGVGSAAGKVTLTTDPETLVAAIAVTDAEGFKQLGRLVGARVHELAGPRGGAFAMRFYAEILAVAGDKLGLDDLKALESVISAARNRKLAADKVTKGGGKKKAGGGKVHLGDEFEQYDEYEVDVKKGSKVGGGNSGNVAGSVAGAGLDGLASIGGTAQVAGTSATAGEAPAFSRSRYAAEDSFM